MFDDVLMQIISISDRAEAIKIVNEFKAAQYSVSKQTPDLGAYSVRLVQVIQRWVNTVTNNNDFDVMLQKLAEMKVFRIDLALDPSVNFLHILGERIKQSFGKEFLLWVFVDRQMLTGIRISVDGNYWDRSGKKRLESYSSWNELISSSFQI